MTIPPISQNDLAAANSGPSATTAATGTSQVTKNMFLQLLVAQIKNQDPLSPADGTQFLTQLAQFQSLEQSMNMGTDLSAIRTDLDTLVGASTGQSATFRKPMVAKRPPAARPVKNQGHQRAGTSSAHVPAPVAVGARNGAEFPLDDSEFKEF